MSQDEIQLMFAHAMLVGLSQNGHLLTANAEGYDIGKMIADKSESIARGYTETNGEHTGR